MPIFLILTLIGTVSGQRGDINIPPKTGSGTIFGNGITKYTTLDYYREFASSESRNVKTTRDIERQVYQKRNGRVDPKSITVPIAFHNHTRMDSRTFTKEISLQMESLRSDFSVSPNAQVKFLRLDKIPESSLQLIEFKLLESDYRSVPIKLDKWEIHGELKTTLGVIDIHVVEEIPERLGHGYARYSWLENEKFPDIIINARSFGSGSGDFKKGKVLTHLIGNYFGLYALNGSGDCEDDWVDDTPIHNIATSFCFEKKDTPISLCDNRPMLTNNFMSHSPDGCKESFTVGQWMRMMLVIDFLKNEKR